MTISYPLQMPSQKLARVKWADEVAVSMATSSFNYAQQVQDHGGQRWTGTLSWDFQMREDKAEIWSFIRKLNGPLGTFLMGVPGEETPRGSAGATPGTPVINGAGQTGNIVNIAGLPLNAVGYLLEDDLIQIGTGSTSRLYSVLEDVNTNGSGEASVTIWPRLREVPGDGDPVVVSNAKGTFRMAKRDPGFNQRTVIYEGLGFEFVEAL